MQRAFEFLSLVSKKEKGEVLEIGTSSINWMDTVHIIKLYRPEADEKKIRETISYRRRDELANWLYSEEVRKEVEDEIAKAIEDEKIRIRNLPVPAIFVWHMVETKIRWGGMILKIQVSLGVAEYLMRSKDDIDQLRIELDRYPNLQDTKKNAQEVVKIFDSFLNTVEDAETIGRDYESFKKVVETSR